MKIACITDTHFGARGDNVIFDNFFRKFYDEIFFPEITKRGITQVIHLGDCFDRRKYINYNSLKTCKEYFFDPLIKNNIKVDMIVGNHDTFFKNTNDVNSPELLLKQYDNITTFDRPSIQTYDGLDILLLPWICTDNYNTAINYIEKKQAKVCFGHLEMEGFMMWKGQENKEGMSPKVFKGYEVVASGHFHHRHNKKNIFYLGNPYEMFWNDYGDVRGFNIFDTETLKFEFVKNPNTMFERISYDGKNTIDPLKLKNKFIKIKVEDKSNQYEYDTFVEKIYEQNPAEVKIIDEMIEVETDASLDVNETDTVTLLNTYIDSVDCKLEKDKIKSMVLDLYKEAQTTL